MIQVRTIDEIFLTRKSDRSSQSKNATSSLGKKHPLGTISLFDGLTNPESLRRTDVTGEKTTLYCGTHFAHSFLFPAGVADGF